MSYTPTGFVRQSDGAILVVSTNDAVTQAATSPTSLPVADPTTLGTAVIVATVAGVDQRTTGAGLVASQTIAINALPLGPSPASANDIMVPVFSISANGPVRYPLATLLALGSGSSGTGSTGSTTATTFTVAVSPASGPVGSTTNLTVTPGSGGWPSGQVVTPVATGVSGTFDQSSKTGSGTNPVVFVFTSTAAGSGTLSATASGMTLSGSAASYAASMATGGGATNLTMTNATYADRGDGSGKKMLTGGMASGSLPVAIRDSTYFNVTMKFRAGSTAYASTSLPFIKLTNSAGQAIGLVLTGTQCVPWTGDYAPNPAGSVPTDGAIHEFAFRINGQYINALIDGNGQGQGQLNSNFSATGPQIAIDMSKGPPGLFSVAIRDGAYTDHNAPWETYEFDGSGAAS